jgi:ABC-type Co2+ transport system permease subunit
VPAYRVARIAVVDCEHWTNPAYVHRYAVVLDPRGDVLLRVAATDDRRRRAALAPLGAPVTYETTSVALAKDYRRRWPEAFGWAHAHTVLTGVGLFSAYVVVVAIAEGLLNG